MATDNTEMESFHRFIGQQLENGGSGMTADEATKAFHAYQRDVERLRSHLQESEDDEGRELDSDALKQRVRSRLSSEGVTD
ncbi:MAG: hypothetical protein MI861_25295 [Pirellulales bacterium]|nr:hypothetical protein [Pirellulales bacterium]